MITAVKICENVDTKLYLSSGLNLPSMYFNLFGYKQMQEIGIDSQKNNYIYEIDDNK